MIKLISLNIERSKHLDIIKPFLEREKPDALCVQELFERDIPFFEKIVGPCRVYGVVGKHPADPPEEGALMEGIGIFSAVPAGATSIEYYAGSESNARSEGAREFNMDRPLVACDIEKDGEIFRVMSAHFTWTPKGEPSDQQRTDMRALLELLDKQKEFVLCGDFNAPRGGEIFAMLADRYTDNIPLQYKTSIDVELHRAGKKPEEKMDQKMVDGLFTTPGYLATDVELHSGVSDHLAILATITTTERATTRVQS